jgi:hypothetical protein
VLGPGEVSLCPEHPGFQEDLQVTADPAELYRLFLGQLSLTAATDDGSVRVDGPPSLVRALPRWFRLHPGSRGGDRPPRPAVATIPSDLGADPVG